MVQRFHLEPSLRVLSRIFPTSKSLNEKFCHEFFSARKGFIQNLPRGSIQNPFISRFYLEPTQGVLQQTFLPSKGFIQDPPRGSTKNPYYCKGFIQNPSMWFCQEPFYNLRVLPRTNPGGSTANPFIFKCIYLEPTQGVLARIVFFKGFI